MHCGGLTEHVGLVKTKVLLVPEEQFGAVAACEYGHTDVQL